MNSTDHSGGTIHIQTSNGWGDRTFKGYDLYSDEVQKRIALAEKKAKKYQDLWNTSIAMLVGSAALVLFSIYVLVMAVAATPQCF